MPSDIPKHLTGPEHYTRAEQLIALAEDQRTSQTSSPDRAIATAATAQAHLMAARLAWDVAASLSDSGLAADWEQATEVTSTTMVAGWPEAIR